MLLRRKALVCQSCGNVPRAGTDPACRECRFILDLPRIRQHAALSAASLRERMAAVAAGQRLYGTGQRAVGKPCAGLSLTGAPCTRRTRRGFCASHRSTDAPPGVPA